MLGFGREPAQEELLCEVGERALAGVDKGAREPPPRAAIRRRIVGRRDGSRGQIATDGRVVRLPPSVVTPADDCAGDCVERAGLLCARALIEVARILVQKRWQDGAADHDVGKAVGIASAIALRVTLRTLAVVGDVSCLVMAAIKTTGSKVTGSKVTFGARSGFDF